MSDNLTSYLLNDARHANISPEGLELMGKAAANLFLDRGVALNEAVVKLASEHDDITQEQVKRVCEFANTAVYLAKHDKNKTAGAASSYPQFELADPNRVIQDLSDGARPSIITPTDISYGQQPLKKEKVSSAFVDEQLAEMFGATDQGRTKLASFTSETAEKEIMDAKNALVGLKQNLEHHAEQFDFALKEASVQYYDLMKRHLLDGGSFVDFMTSAIATGVSHEKIAAITQPFVEKLLSEKVTTADTLENDLSHLHKIASRVVNEAHPFVTTFKSVVAIDDEITKVATALDDVEAQLRTINGFIKETFLAGSSL